MEGVNIYPYYVFKYYYAFSSNLEHCQALMEDVDIFSLGLWEGGNNYILFVGLSFMKR